MSQADFGPYMECSLALAEDLVNTMDPEDGSDSLTSAEALSAFLNDHEVTDVRKAVPSDVAEVAELRAALREVFATDDEQRAAQILNELLATSGAQPILTNHDGGWHLHYTPAGAPLRQRIAAEAAMALSVIIAQEGFDRLKMCDGHGCVDVFVDASRNRSRRYCSPEICGNRASVAAYRERRRAERAAKSST